MHTFFDNQIIKKIACEHIELAQNLPTEITFNWSSLLQLLGLDDLMKSFPKFDQTNELFDYYVTTLSEEADQEMCFTLYDNLFAECLTQIKSMERIQASSLLERIREQPQDSLFIKPLEDYKYLLTEHPKNSIHGLILYLAWDRFCICISHLFDHQSTNQNFQSNLATLKECLIESYVHITQQGHARPSFFRLVEALYFYIMREEFLQTHPDGDWQILSKGVTALTEQERVVDVLYVDAPADSAVYTLDSMELVRLRLDLANLMRNQLGFDPHPIQVFYLTQQGNKLVGIDA